MRVIGQGGVEGDGGPAVTAVRRSCHEAVLTAVPRQRIHPSAPGVSDPVIAPIVCGKSSEVKEESGCEQNVAARCSQMIVPFSNSAIWHSSGP